MMLVPDDVWPSKTRLCTACKHSLPSHPRRALPAGEPLARLRSSIFPSMAELERMAPLVVEVAREVALYDETIAHVQRVLRKLTGDRDKLQQYLVRQRGLSAPIRRLTPQILIIVFRYVCHGTRREDNRHPASILRAVCVKWFNVTASCPGLWACINIIDVPSTLAEWWSPRDERERQDIPRRNGLVAAAQAVAFSRGEMLDVTVLCPSGMSSLLGQSHERWRSLTISEDVLLELGKVGDLSLSRLEEMTVITKGVSPRSLPKLSLSLSNLRRLVYIDALPNNGVLQPGAFEHLRHLELRIGDHAQKVSLASVCDCISQMPHLTSLCLSLPDFLELGEESNPSSSAIITLPSVNSFSWTSGTRGVACLDKLHFPSLSHLALTGALGSTAVDGVLRLLERSPAHIGELVLNDLDDMVSPEDLIRLVSSSLFTDLTRLSMKELRGTGSGCLTAQVFLALSGNHLAKRICRKLSHVEFVWNSQGELERVVLDVIESRWYGKAHGERLESAALGVYGREMHDWEETFSILRKRGLRIYHLCL